MLPALKYLSVSASTHNGSQSVPAQRPNSMLPDRQFLQLIANKAVAASVQSARPFVAALKSVTAAATVNKHLQQQLNIRLAAATTLD